MNKKGFVITTAVAMLIIFFTILIVLFVGGGIGGFLLNRTLSNIPIFGWVIGFIVLFFLIGGKK